MTARLMVLLGLIVAMLGACGDYTARATPVKTTMYDGDAAKVAADAIAKKVGGDVKVLRVEVYPDRVEMNLQDPKDAAKAIHYEYKKGKVTGPIPVTLTGGGSLAENVWPLADVDMAGIPALARAAQERTGLPDGKIEVMRLTRPPIVVTANSSWDPRWAITIAGGGKSATALADLKGAITSVDVKDKTN